MIKTKGFIITITAIAALSLSACGSGSGGGGGGGGTATAAQQQQITTFLQGLGGMSSVFNSFSALQLGLVTDDSIPQLTVACDTGSIEITETSTGGTIVYSTCIFGDVTINGTITLETIGDTSTITYDNVTFTDGTDTLTMSGSMSINDATNTLTLTSLSFTVDGDTFTMNGELTIDENGTPSDASDDTISGTLTFMVNGTTVADCTFTGEPVNMSQAQIDNACDF